MRKIIWSLSILVLSVTLFSSCTLEKITPAVTTQGTSQSTLLTTPQIYGNPTVTPVDESTAAPAIGPVDVLPSETVPTDIVPPTTTLPDIVLLGMPWADFSLRFDPLQWEISAFDDDWPELQSLTHKTLASCRIIPNIPVGLGADWTIKDEQVVLGQLALQKKSFYLSGTLIFVGYYNFLNHYGDGAVEVHFVDDINTCIQAAEALFAVTVIILP
jgi:hypothetical protein